MASLTLSIDFFENINFHYIKTILHRLDDDYYCTHRVAIDSDCKLFRVYCEKCNQEYLDQVAAWIKCFTNGYCKFDKTPNFHIDPTAIQDKNIFEMTLKLIGEKMMVVDSLQSTWGYAHKTDSDSQEETARIVDCKYADEFLNRGNNLTDQIIINHSIVATNGASITHSKIKHSSYGQ